MAFSIRNLDTKKWLDFYVGGLLLFLLKPFAMFASKILSRDHSLKVNGEIVFLKLLGGGSLVIAFPSLLGIRKRYPNAKLTLVTTASVAPFAEILNVFDRIVVIQDRSLISFIISSIAAYLKCFKRDTFIDFEVYSRLSTFLSYCTLARNRIGFYLESIFWRQNFHTHLVYLNRFSPIHLFYEQITYLLDAFPASIAESRAHLVHTLSRDQNKSGSKRIAIGHSCSDLARERMLKPEEWKAVFQGRIKTGMKYEISFIGGPGDRAFADEVIRFLSPHFRDVSWLNLCGKRDLRDSLANIYNADEYWGIDTSLTHFSRLFGIKTLSYWGPTSPDILLQPLEGLEEEIYYEKIHCSPCVHITETPPCGGNNLCIKRLFDKGYSVEGKDSLFTTWSC